MVWTSYGRTLQFWVKFWHVLQCIMQAIDGDLPYDLTSLYWLGPNHLVSVETASLWFWFLPWGPFSSRWSQIDQRGSVGMSGGAAGPHHHDYGVSSSPFLLLNWCHVINRSFVKSRKGEGEDKRRRAHCAPEEDASLISVSSRNSNRIQKLYAYAYIKSIKEKNL